MEAGSSFEAVETTMLGSGEFNARAGGTKVGSVNLLYETVLNRAPDSAGLSHLSTLLNRGFSTYTVPFLVVHSTEARQDLVNGYYLEFLGRAARSRRPGCLHGFSPGWHLR
jgi:hypothetical protein